MVSNTVAAEAGAYAPSAPEWVVFSCSAHLFAFPLEHVREILTPRPFTRLPGAGPGVCGLIGLRGRALTVLDLGVILGLQPATAAPDHRLLLVECGVRRIGVAVDEVVVIARAALDNGVVRGAGAGGPPAEALPAALGTATIDTGRFVALDPVAVTSKLLQ
jgi:chemotaxis signal transduction protein